MSNLRLGMIVLLSTLIALPEGAGALPVAAGLAKNAFSGDVEQVAARRIPQGGGGGRATAHRGGASRTTTTRHVTSNAGRGTVKTTTVNRNTKVNTVNVNKNRNVTVHVRHGGYRPWVARPYYGRVIAGVAIGTVITAAVVGAVPTAPSPDLCWFWSDNRQVSGYWDYCNY